MKPFCPLPDIRIRGSVTDNRTIHLFRCHLVQYTVAKRTHIRIIIYNYITASAYIHYSLHFSFSIEHSLNVIPSAIIGTITLYRNRNPVLRNCLEESFLDRQINQYGTKCKCKDSIIRANAALHILSL